MVPDVLPTASGNLQWMQCRPTPTALKGNYAAFTLVAAWVRSGWMGSSRSS